MDFSFSEEQEMLRTLARDFLNRECPKTKVRELMKDEKGYDPQMWHKMAELGWMGLVFPEEYGGIEANFLDLAALIEEMGKNILPGPFFSSVVLCALPILEYGTSEQKSELLPEIASGEAIWSLALIESSASFKASEIKTTARLEGDEYALQGDKFLVPDAHIADHLLVAARIGDKEEDITLFIVDTKDPGVEVELIPTLAGDKQCQVCFNEVRVPQNNILGRLGQGWDIIDFILQRAAILKCAEMLGACQAVLYMTNEYAKDRVQFDKPIGSFQVIQHRLVDMLIDMEGIQYLIYQAAWGISTGSPSRLQISIAKAKTNEVYQRICLDGIKIHGAIGFTMDHDIGLYYLRVKASEFAAGGTDLHLENIAVALGL